MTATDEIAALWPREDRFAQLVERRLRFVFRVAFAVLRNSHDAEDVVQETFLKLYRLGAWETMCDEGAFLARVAWRLAVDRRRRGPELVSERAHSANPEELAVATDRSALIHRMVDALPEQLRQPLALSSVGEMNYREISAVMAIPEGTVRTRLARARQVLREKLARHL